MVTRQQVWMKGTFTMLMPNLVFSIIFLIAFPVVLQSTHKNPDLEQDNIRQCFALYREAVSNGNYKQAALGISKNTVQYYSQAKDLALKAPEPEVRRLPPLDKLNVLLLRHYHTMESLRGMTPEDVFVFSYNQGFGSLNPDMRNIGIGPIEIEGDGLKASAEVTVRGRAVPRSLQFVKEEGKWKIDLANLAAMANEDLAIIFKGQESEVDIRVIKAIEAISNKKVSPNLWQPLMRTRVY